jgi:hypothetical protein
MTQRQNNSARAVVVGIAILLCACGEGSTNRFETSTESLAARREVVGSKVLSQPGVKATERSAGVDGAISGNNFDQILMIAREARDRDELINTVNWVRYHVARGEGGYGLAWTYAILLDALARSSEPNEEARSVRKMALRYLLYSLALTRVDGAICRNEMRVHLAGQDVLVRGREMLDWAGELSSSERFEIVERAVAMERASAYIRAPDDQLCGATGQLVGGHALVVGLSMLDRLSKGSPTDAYVYKTQWGPDQDRARLGLAALLGERSGLFGAPNSREPYPTASSLPGLEPIPPLH